jgi:hypothetical protein
MSPNIEDEDENEHENEGERENPLIRARLDTHRVTARIPKAMTTDRV